MIFKNFYPEYFDSWFGVSYIEKKLLGEVTNGKSIKPFNRERPYEGTIHSEVGIGSKKYKYVGVKLNLEQEKFLEFLGRVQ